MKKRYTVMFVYGDIRVMHMNYLFLQDALCGAYWHSRYNGAEAIEIWHGSELISDIKVGDES